MKRVKFLFASIAAALSLGAAAPASAVLITQWSADFDNGFINIAGGPTVHGVSGTENPISGLGNFPFTSVAWGQDQGNGQSSLSVSQGPTGVGITTNGGASAAVTLTHHNVQVGLGGGTLTNADLVSQLTLTPVTPSGPAVVDHVNRKFQIRFKETNNFPANGNCGFPSTSKCDDIFVLENPIELTQQFTLDGILYTLTIGTVGNVLHALSDAACAQANAAPGCIGFQTPEFSDTSLQTNISITARPISVPEPVSLALLGLVAVGLGVARRGAQRVTDRPMQYA